MLTTGFTRASKTGMNSSINEVAALAKKAAKGAGYSWSMADEAAFATAWLCRNGLDGATILAEHLSYVHSCGVKTTQLHAFQQPWCADESGLCALSAGASVSDLALDESILSVELNQLITPTLLLPFVAYAATCWHVHNVSDVSNTSNRSNVSNRSPSVGQATLQCSMFEADILTRGRVSWLHRYVPTDTAVSSAGNQTKHPIQCCDTHYRIGAYSGIHGSEPLDGNINELAATAQTHRTEITNQALATLNHFAASTYAPATDASRRGAGAGNTDND